MASQTDIHSRHFSGHTVAHNLKKSTPYRCLPRRGSGAYARSNIDLVN